MGFLVRMRTTAAVFVLMPIDMHFLMVVRVVMPMMIAAVLLIFVIMIVQVMRRDDFRLIAYGSDRVIRAART